MTKVAFVYSPVISGLPIKISNVETSYTMYVRMSPTTQFTPGKVISRGQYHEGSTTWNFTYTDQSESVISIVIVENNAIRAEFSRLALPLRWFESNAVITQSFPMKVTESFKALPVMMDVCVHLCENGEPAFLARPGRMTVTPAWETWQPQTHPNPQPAPVCQPPATFVPPPVPEEENDIPPIEGAPEPQFPVDDLVCLPFRMSDGSIQMMWCRPVPGPGQAGSEEQ